MSTKVRGVAFMLALAPALAIAMPAWAQDANTQIPMSELREKVRAACAADVAKHCAEIERAKGAMRSCMQAHEAQLSDGCKAARAERASARSKEKG